MSINLTLLSIALNQRFGLHLKADYLVVIDELLKLMNHYIQDMNYF